MNNQKLTTRINTLYLLLEDNASSSIKSIKWERNKPIESNKSIEELIQNQTGILSIVFKTNNKEYSYLDIPIDLFYNMINSDSYGKFFFKNIINKFTCTKKEE